MCHRREIRCIGIYKLYTPCSQNLVVGQKNIRIGFLKSFSTKLYNHFTKKIALTLANINMRTKLFI